MIYYDIHSHQLSASPNDVTILSLDLRQPEPIESGYYSVGIHPWYANVDKLPLVQTLAGTPNVVAIGEIGLDKLAAVPLEMQKEIFRYQIQIAENANKPIIIHCVKAWSELIEIHKKAKSDIPWIIHGFRGNGELATQLLHLGFYLSFGINYQTNALCAAWKSHRLYAETDDRLISIKTIFANISSQLSISEEELTLEISENLQTWPNSFVNIK